MKVGLRGTSYNKVVMFVKVESHPGMRAFDHLQGDFHERMESCPRPVWLICRTWVDLNASSFSMKAHSFGSANFVGPPTQFSGA